MLSSKLNQTQQCIEPYPTTNFLDNKVYTDTDSTSYSEASSAPVTIIKLGANAYEIVLFRNLRLHLDDIAQSTMEKVFYWSLILFSSTLWISYFKTEVATEPEARFLWLWPYQKTAKLLEGNCTDAQGRASGICTTKQYCLQRGGSTMGRCARQGRGVCCQMTYNCSQFPQYIKANGSRLVSPVELPQPTSVCEYRLTRPVDVCQVRLDFNRFEISQGNYSVEPIGCNLDTLRISGASNLQNVGVLCGNLTKQQVYLDFGTNSEINISIGTVTEGSQKWDLQVTYIKRESTERAPVGCLQYFQTVTGTVTSFNYPIRQLDNEDYSICIQKLPGMNKITWDKCDGFRDFIISGQPPTQSPGPGFPDFIEPNNGSSCETDWFLIFGDNKYCGNFFLRPVTTTSQPFIANVHFDDAELPNDFQNTGFCMRWTQSP